MQHLVLINAVLLALERVPRSWVEPYCNACAKLPYFFAMLQVFKRFIVAILHRLQLRPGLFRRKKFCANNSLHHNFFDNRRKKDVRAAFHGLLRGLDAHQMKARQSPCSALFRNRRVEEWTEMDRSLLLRHQVPARSVRLLHLPTVCVFQLSPLVHLAPRTTKQRGTLVPTASKIQIYKTSPNNTQRHPSASHFCPSETA